MPFKKGTSGNPIGRPKGSVSTTSKLIREHISQAIDGNKIMEMLEKIDSPKLEKKFGQEYLEYKKKVRRWL